MFIIYANFTSSRTYREMGQAFISDRRTALCCCLLYASASLTLRHLRRQLRYSGRKHSSKLRPSDRVTNLPNNRRTSFILFSTNSLNGFFFRTFIFALNIRRLFSLYVFSKIKLSFFCRIFK